MFQIRDGIKEAEHLKTKFFHSALGRDTMFLNVLYINTHVKTLVFLVI